MINWFTCCISAIFLTALGCHTKNKVFRIITRSRFWLPGCHKGDNGGGNRLYLLMTASTYHDCVFNTFHIPSWYFDTSKIRYSILYMTSFFRFVNKRAIYRLGIISLAHAPVHVTDFAIINVHFDELSSARI